MKKCTFILPLFMIFAVNAFSADAPKFMEAYVETYVETNARDAGTSNNESVAGQDWIFDFFLPENYTLELYTGGTKKIEGSDSGGSWEDSYVQMEKNLYKSDFMSFSLSGRYIAPLSETSRDETHMNWGMQIRPTFLFTLFKEGDMRLTFRTRPTYNEYFYSQEYDNGGYYNIQRVFNWANRLHLDVTSWMYAQLHANFSTRWNTNGDHIDDKWAMGQMIGFTLTTNIYLEFYHSSGSRFYDDKGRRRNMDIFDNKISTYKALIGFTF